MNIANLWYPESTARGLCDWLVWMLLLPFSVVYAVISLTIQYSTQVIQRLGFGYRAPVPVIVVGNFTVGGTGKTPLVAYLCEQLQAKGYSPGIISRGYGRTHRTTQSVTLQATATAVGDEALWLHQKTRCPVVVANRKNTAIQTLLSQYPATNVIISDDGLQHAALQPTVRIAVVDGTRGLGNGWCLPAGPLRAPSGIGRFSKADICLVNGEALNIEAAGFIDLKQDQNIVSIEHFVQQHRHQTIHAVAGIGNPARFFRLLTDMGLTLEMHPFPDHHAFALSDLSFDTPGPIVMTEKDAVKCSAWLKTVQRDCWALAIHATIEERFLKRTLQMVEDSKAYVG